MVETTSTSTIFCFLLKKYLFSLLNLIAKQKMEYITFSSYNTGQFLSNLIFHQYAKKVNRTFYVRLFLAIIRNLDFDNESHKKTCLILNNLYYKISRIIWIWWSIIRYVSCCFLKEIQTVFHLNRKWYPKVFSDVHVKSISMAPAPRNFCFCAWM